MKLRSVILPVFILYSVTTVLSDGGLYKHGGPVTNFDALNFTDVYHKPYSYFIVFYAHWCGHCHHFAPIWTKFATTIKEWSHLIQPAAIDCADKTNEALCTQYKVQAFPTVMLFKPQSTKDTMPTPIQLGFNEHSMLNGTVRLLHNMTKNEHHLDPVKTRQGVQKQLAKRYKVEPYDGLLALVVENSNSYVGRALILDFDKIPEVEVFRLVSPTESTEPPRLELRRNQQGPWRNSLLNVTDKTAHHIFRDHIRKQLGLPELDSPKSGEPPDAKKGDPHHEDVKHDEDDDEEGEPNKIGKVLLRGHRRDIETALHYTLTHDVSMKGDISGPALEGLTQFIDVLTRYYPCPPHVAKFLEQSKNWLSHQSQITGKQWTDFMASSRSEEAYLPETDGAPYTGCKGSEPQYRGYPCGLWSLFHVLAAEAYSKSLLDSANFDARQVVTAMVHFIPNFFSCQECGKNFAKETANMQSQVQSSKDAIMYLWRVHNKVNKRLSQNESDDPEFPKMEFPYPKQCPRCRVKKDADAFYMFDSIWNEKEVLMFLLSYYLPKHLVQDTNALYFIPAPKASTRVTVDPHWKRKKDLRKNSEKRELKHKAMHEKIERLYRKKLGDTDRLGKVQYFREIEYKTRKTLAPDGITNTDLGLCVFFYLICVCLLVIVYMKITMRKGANVC